MRFSSSFAEVVVVVSLVLMTRSSDLAAFVPRFETGQDQMVR